MFKLRAINLLQFRLQLFCQNSASKPLDSKRTPKAKLRILGTRAPSFRISIRQCAKPFLIYRSVNPLDLLYKLVNLNRILPLGKYLLKFLIISRVHLAMVVSAAAPRFLIASIWNLFWDDALDYFLERRLCLSSLSFDDCLCHVLICML